MTELEIETPTLFPYQKFGAEWLSNRRFALLGDEMGLGKTAQAITACDLIDAERILVLCPAVARVNWLREFKSFSKRERKFDIIKESNDFSQIESSVICSYDLATKNYTKLKKPFDVLILDEAHYLKSPNAKRTWAVLGEFGIIRDVKRCWAISGTPAPNHAAELWPLFYTLGWTKLLYGEFVKRYCTFYQVPNKKTLQITGTKMAMIPEIKEMLSYAMLRRKKDDVMTELPPIKYDYVSVPAGPVDLYTESTFIQYVMPEDRTKELTDKLLKEDQILNQMWEATGRGASGLLGLEAIAKSVSTLRMYTGCQKVQPVADLIAEELEMGAYEKIVIFAVHRDVIEGLRVRLSKFKPVTLYGGTAAETRQKNIDKFQTNPKCRVFIGNIQAAGTAITLTAAHNVMFVEQDWVPGNNAQATMRCHRIGQTKPVFVRFVALEDSIDEKITAALKRKTKELTAMFDEEFVRGEDIFS